jgi:hypothetical protein
MLWPCDRVDRELRAMLRRCDQVEIGPGKMEGRFRAFCSHIR